MNPQSARTLGAVHAAQSPTGQAVAQRRHRRRGRLKEVLQRIKDKPLRLATDLAAYRTVRVPENAPSNMSKTSRAGLLMGAAAMSVAAQGLTSFGPQFSQHTYDNADATSYANIRRHATQLQPSDEFIEALAQEEGIRYTVYRDVAGYPTVGVGHLILPEDNLRVGDRISHEKALDLLRQDVAKAAEGVRGLVGNLRLYQHEFDALTDLVFNVGAGNVSQEESPRLNEAIQMADYQGIAGELQYHHAGGSKANGLVHRSERREQIFLNGNYDDPREQLASSDNA